MPQRRSPPARKPHRSRKAAKPVTATVTIDRLGKSGDGMAGEVAVPFTLPGEEVVAAIAGGRGAVQEILSPAPERIAPPCPHFGPMGDLCGGCALQHVSLDDVLSWKVARVRAALERVLGEVPEAFAIQSPRASRRRAHLALLRTGKGWQMGFRQSRSHRIAPIASCEVLAPEVFAAGEAICAAMDQLAPKGVKAAGLHLTATDQGIDASLTGIDEAELGLGAREAAAGLAEVAGLARLSVDDVPIVSRAAPHVTFDGLPVPLPTQSFLQATKHGERALQQAVLEAVPATGEVADLFCGLGTFALPISAQHRVYAADLDGPSTMALQYAAQRAGRDMEVVARDLFEDPLTPRELSRFSAVVLDPPRAGAAAQFGALAESDVPSVIAVSCNPDTLARDLKALGPAYVMRQLVILDQFLWSPHTEVVCVMEKC